MKTRERILLPVVGILLAAAFCAYAGVALVNASPIWERVTMTAVVAILLYSPVAALHRNANWRSFWGGFAVFGWCYFLVAVTPWFANLKPKLLTSTTITALREAVQGDLALSVQGQRQLFKLTQPTPLPPTAPSTQLAFTQRERVVVRTAAPSSAASLAVLTAPQNFENIAHALWAIVLGAAGGLIGCLCGMWANRSESNHANLK